MSREMATKMVPSKVVVSTTCDGCSRTVSGTPKGWLHFSTSHGDWGNDSCESSRYYDACSFSCFMTVCRRLVAGGHISETFELGVYSMDREFFLGMVEHARPHAMGQEESR